MILYIRTEIIPLDCVVTCKSNCQYGRELVILHNIILMIFYLYALAFRDRNLRLGQILYDKSITSGGRFYPKTVSVANAANYFLDESVTCKDVTDNGSVAMHKKSIGLQFRGKTCSAATQPQPLLRHPLIMQKG